MWEYKTVVIKAKTSFMGNKFDIAQMDIEFNNYGNDGWELVSVVISSRGYVERLICVFKRQK